MVENRVLYQLFIVICNLMAVEYIALYTHQALEQKSLTLDLAIAVLHNYKEQYIVYTHIKNSNIN